MEFYYGIKGTLRCHLWMVLQAVCLIKLTIYIIAANKNYFQDYHNNTTMSNVNFRI